MRTRAPVWGQPTRGDWSGFAVRRGEMRWGYRDVRGDSISQQEVMWMQWRMTCRWWAWHCSGKGDSLWWFILMAAVIRSLTPLLLGVVLTGHGGPRHFLVIYYCLCVLLTLLCTWFLIDIWNSTQGCFRSSRINESKETSQQGKAPKLWSGPKREDCTDHS